MATEITSPIMLDSTGRDISAAILAVRAALINCHGICYGFHVDGAESDTASKITYLRDAVNASKMPLMVKAIVIENVLLKVNTSIRSENEKQQEAGSDSEPEQKE